jgi:hypothetical protein
VVQEKLRKIIYMISMPSKSYFPLFIDVFSSDWFILLLSTILDKGAMPGTSYNRGVPNTAFRPIGTAAQRGPLQSSQGKFGGAPASRSGLGTAAGYGGGGEARPMTSVSSAGYKGSTNKGDKGGGVFDPLNIGRGPAPPLAEKADNSHEDKAKEMEKNVHRLIEASAKALAIDKDYQKALDKAKEAGSCFLFFQHLPFNPDFLCFSAKLHFFL